MAENREVSLFPLLAVPTAHGISATLYQEIQKHKLAGIRFMPMAQASNRGPMKQDFFPQPTGAYTG